MFTFLAQLLRQRAPALPDRVAPPLALAQEPEDGSGDLVLMRHAVLNRDKRIAGYEFLQVGPVGSDDVVNERAFLKLLASVVAGTPLGKRRAFAAIAPALLFDSALEPLALSGVTVLLRFGSDIEGVTAFSQRMQAMRSSGMGVGLADARVALAHPALGQAASLGFLPVDQISPPDLLEAVRLLNRQHPQMQLFACGLRDHEEFEVCRRLKMQGFSGPFASHRRDWPSKAIDPGTVRLCQLVSGLRAGAEMEHIIRDIKLDPLLSYRVLAYANSAGVAAQHRVQTLKDAVLMIGREPLFRWLVLLLCASGPAPQDQSALLENALVRGRMMELLAHRIESHPAGECFLTGVLSLLDVLLQQPAAALFESLALPAAVQAALLQDQGPYADLLRLVAACEQQRSAGAQDLCTALGITPRQLSQAQSDALEWARGQGPAEAEEATFAPETFADAFQHSPALPEVPDVQSLPQSAQAATVPAALMAVFEAAQAGEPDAQCDLGARYAVGDGVAQDAAQSLACYTRAAQQGNANAQWNAAVMHAQGQGGAKVDEEQAFMWCEKAADQGFAAAQATLGLMYSTGQGAEKDLDKALALLELAAVQGDLEAQYNLAVLLSKEPVEEQNLQQALVWFARAAEQGLPAAQARLGLMLATGSAPDLIEACKWFFIADAGQHGQAKANLEHSLTLMQPEQIAEAQQRARAWMQAHAAASAV